MFRVQRLYTELARSPAEQQGNPIARLTRSTAQLLPKNPKTLSCNCLCFVEPFWFAVDVRCHLTVSVYMSRLETALVFATNVYFGSRLFFHIVSNCLHAVLAHVKHVCAFATIYNITIYLFSKAIVCELRYVNSAVSCLVIRLWALWNSPRIPQLFSQDVFY